MVRMKEEKGRIPRVHARVTLRGMIANGDITSLCGVPNVPAFRLTDDDKKVTCRRCWNIIMNEDGWD